MSDEEQRREERLAAIGEPSRRRQVERARLVSALQNLLTVVAPGRNVTTDLLGGAPMTVAGVLYFQKLVREAFAPPIAAPFRYPRRRRP